MKLKSTTVGKLLILLILLLPLRSNSQFINDTILSVSALTPSQMERYDTIINNTYLPIDTMGFVTVSDLVSTNVNGKIQVETGINDCGGMEFTILDIDYEDGDNYMFIASIVNDDAASECISGTMTFISDSGVFYALLNYGGQQYELLNLGEGLSLFILVNNEGIGCDALTKSDAITIVPPDNEYCLPCVTDVIEIYSQNAKDHVEGKFDIGMPKYLNAQVMSFNARASLSASSGEIPPKIRLKHHAMYDGLTVIPGISNDSILLHLNGSFFIDSIRTQHQGDLVGFIDAPGYLINHTGGAAWNLNHGNPSDRGAGYHFANLNSTSNFTYSHEVAHNFGALHTNQPTWSAARGKQFEVANKKYETIMRPIEVNSIATIDNFSNPNIQYRGVSTGKIGSRYNFWFMSRNRCTVAALDETVTNVFWITGESYACPLESVTISACNFFLPNPAHTFNWETSRDGIIWTPVASGRNINVIAPASPGSILFTRCTFTRVIPLQGTQILTRYHNITVGSSTNGAICAQKRNPDHELSFDLTVYPNPATSRIVIAFDQPGYSYTPEIAIFDPRGRIVFNNKFIVSGSKELVIDVSQFVPGLYLIKSTNRNETFSQRFIIE